MPLYSNPNDIPLATKGPDNTLLRRLLSLANARFGAGGSGSSFPLSADVSADGHSITNAASLRYTNSAAALAGFDRVVYVGMRSDGFTGSGFTPADCLNANAGTQAARQLAHDAIMRDIVRAGDLVVYLPNPGKNDYMTNGYSGSTNGFYMKEGTVYSAMIPGQTRIRLHSLAVQNTQVMFKTREDRNNPFSGIYGITFDCAGDTLGGSGISINAYELNGDHVRASKVGVLNSYGHFASGKESFPGKISEWVKSSVSTAQYTQPAVNSTVVISVADSAPFTVLDTVHIYTTGGATAGYYQITAKAAGQITAKNLGYAGSVAPTTVVVTAAAISNNQAIIDTAHEDCWQDWVRGDYGSGFFVFAEADKLTQGDLIRCKLFNSLGNSVNTGASGSLGGITGSKSYGRMIDCYAQDVARFFYTEGPNGNLQIRGCMGRNLGHSAVYINGAGGNTFSNILIDDCDFEVNNLALNGSEKWAMDFTAPTLGNINDVRITNTRLALLNVAAQTTYGILADNVTNLYVDDTVRIDAGLPCVLAASAPCTILRFDAKTPAGSPAVVATTAQSTIPTW